MLVQLDHQYLRTCFHGVAKAKRDGARLFSTTITSSNREVMASDIVVLN